MILDFQLEPAGRKQQRISPHKSHSQEQHRSGGLRFQPDAVIHRILEALLTAKITLCRLDGHVPEQKLYLFELPASLVTETGTGPAEVVRSNRPKHGSRRGRVVVPTTASSGRGAIEDLG